MLRAFILNNHVIFINFIHIGIVEPHQRFPFPVALLPGGGLNHGERQPRLIAADDAFNFCRQWCFYRRRNVGLTDRSRKKTKRFVTVTRF